MTDLVETVVVDGHVLDAGGDAGHDEVGVWRLRWRQTDDCSDCDVEIGWLTWVSVKAISL